MRAVIFCAAISLLTSAGEANAQTAAPANLPVSRVALYTSGVGYFERSGTVAGNASETLLFPIGQINDILKSLVLLDAGGGTIEPVTFAAQDPVAKQLQAFSVDLSDNPDRATLLNRLRGAQVRVSVGVETFTGTILGVESKTIQLPSNGGTTQRQILSLMTDTGIRSVDLDSLTAIQFLDPKLDAEIRSALTAVSQSRDASKRAVTLNFDGHGSRRVVVGYVTETPLWQTSYRLVLGDKPILQGWATVQNTSQDDWSGVHLSLISGRPVSFIQDLYTPIYVPRPTVQAQVANAPGPQTYGGNLQATESGNGAVTSYSAAMPAAAPPAFDSFAAKSRAMNAPMGLTAPYAAEQLARQNIATKGAQLGTSLFAYDISVPVSVPRMQSAMIPFLSSAVQGRRVSIYNAAVLPDHPMSGARIVNSSNMHLMGGPITVFDAQQGGLSGYVGDAEIEDTEPGQTRLLSFAVDLGVDASTEAGDDQGMAHTLSIDRGVLYDTVKTLSSVTYTFKNNAKDARLLVVEQPIPGDSYTLIEPPKADEKTADRYRFDMPLPARASKTLRVKLEHTDSQTYALIDCDLNTLLVFAQSGTISAPVKAALQEAARRRRAVADDQYAINGVNRQIAAISAGQDRIRKNMGALDHNSTLYKRYTAELDQQETQLQQLSDRRDTLQAQLARDRTDLSSYVSNLTVK